MWKQSHKKGVIKIMDKNIDCRYGFDRKKCLEFQVELSSNLRPLPAECVSCPWNLNRDNEGYPEGDFNLGMEDDDDEE
jgi:hypothetical protein